MEVSTIVFVIVLATYENTASGKLLGNQLITVDIVSRGETWWIFLRIDKWIQFRYGLIGSHLMNQIPALLLDTLFSFVLQISEKLKLAASPNQNHC